MWPSRALSYIITSRGLLPITSATFRRLEASQWTGSTSLARSRKAVLTLGRGWYKPNSAGSVGVVFLGCGHTTFWDGPSTRLPMLMASIFIHYEWQGPLVLLDNLCFRTKYVIWTFLILCFLMNRIKMKIFITIDISWSWRMLHDVFDYDTSSLLHFVKLFSLFSAGITAMAPTLQDLGSESVYMTTKSLPRRDKFFLL